MCIFVKQNYVISNSYVPVAHTCHTSTITSVSKFYTNNQKKFCLVSCSCSLIPIFISLSSASIYNWQKYKVNDQYQLRTEKTFIANFSRLQYDYNMGCNEYMIFKQKNL